jgi:hypothetical protein
MGYDTFWFNKPPVTLHCDMDFNDSLKNDNIYINPVVFSNFRTNPFNEIQRIHPVEMPYKLDNTYLLTMDIPKGYQVEEMPTPAIVRLNKDDGLFEYIIEKSGDNIQLRVRTKLNKTNFAVDEYAGLRDFFSSILKKENEHIVLKKIK